MISRWNFRKIFERSILTPVRCCKKLVLISKINVWGNVVKGADFRNLYNENDKNNHQKLKYVLLRKQGRIFGLHLPETIKLNCIPELSITELKLSFPFNISEVLFVKLEEFWKEEGFTMSGRYLNKHYHCTKNEVFH